MPNYMARYRITDKKLGEYTGRFGTITIIDLSGEHIRNIWNAFISQGTPRLKDWELQQLSAFDSAHSDYEITR